ncbi:hypothetical protein [Calothrix sp. PCC 7507]|uniref:hypothetical protein n=1 Tax=Calothrix sp. PCC 7507 TaxID=99598 RepID=UPI00029F418A|nr:hypothetical protein [Calothrix sp. PCC 7507]AFY32340.1 hypothetical protein Cal7507_1891 [Calothrix sp. PCC 7507]
MNKFAKGLLVALVLATPVALVAPAFQAEAATAPTPATKSVTKHAFVKGLKTHSGKKTHHKKTHNTLNKAKN